MSKSTDCTDLYHRCCSEDPPVQTAAYQELGELLMRVGLFRIQSNPHLYHHVEECAQETLIAIWEQVNTPNGPQTPRQFCAWASRIMIHKVIDMLRYERYIIRGGDKSASPGQDKSLDEQNVEDDPDQEPADPKSSHLEEDVIGQLQIEAILNLILNSPVLSEDERTVLFHGFILELDDIELAAMLGKERATIRTIRRRGLNKLRDDDDLIALLRE